MSTPAPWLVSIYWGESADPNTVQLWFSNEEHARAAVAQAAWAIGEFSERGGKRTHSGVIGLRDDFGEVMMHGSELLAVRLLAAEKWDAVQPPSRSPFSFLTADSDDDEPVSGQDRKDN